MINWVLQLNNSQSGNSFNSLLEKFNVLNSPNQPNPNPNQSVIDRGNLIAQKMCLYVSGESTELEWNIFPGFTSLQLCDKISNLLSSLGQTPESFTRRILFMSMFNDIFCDRYDNKDECLRNANIVKTFAG